MAPISDTDVQRFAALFSGYEKAYGAFTPRGADASGKTVGKYQTLRGQPTEATYRAHLEGSQGLGIVMLRDDNTVLFGAIDYDVKNMDHAKAEAKVRELNLPLVLCRSKSGGGHFYCFLAEPVPAEWLMDRLSEWASLLGMAANTEKFPKQSSRFNDQDVGNWINLPYFGGEGSTRYAVINGKPATLQEFLDYAESLRIGREAVQRAVVRESTLFEDGPPCLQTLETQGGFIQGTKKEGMFSVVVYLKKRFPDDWEDHVDEYNRAMANIRSDELQTIVKSLKRKDYDYKCKVPPLNAVCNRRACRGCSFGVGEGGGVGNIKEMPQGIIRYETPNEGDEPLYGMEVRGRRVLLTHTQLYNRDEFNRQCLAQANVIPVRMSPAKWLEALQELVLTADVVMMPEDASPVGQLWEWIVTFMTEQVFAPEREKVLLGTPYREGQHIYFRSQDLFGYLDARRIQYKSKQHVWDLLERKGGEKKFWNLKGRGVNVVRMPAPFDMDGEPPAPPKPDDSGKEPF